MKHINIAIEEEQYERLLQRKGKLSWPAFLLTLAEAPARTWEQVAVEAKQSEAKATAETARKALATEQSDWTCKYRAATTEEERLSLKLIAKAKGWIKESEYIDDDV